VLAAPAAGDRMAEEMLPIPQIASSAAAIGHTDVEVDGDGVARGVYLHAGIGKAHWPALGLALADLPPGTVHGLPDPDPQIGSPYQWRRDDYVRVRYAGPPERLPQVSYADVLDGHVDTAMLHGRRIVVGMTASGIAPRLLTPTTREYWMSGSEYLAARHQRRAGRVVRAPARPAPAMACRTVLAAASTAAELVAVACR